MTEEGERLEEDFADPDADGSWTVHGLPRQLRHCQLANFRWDLVRPSGLRPAVADFLRDAGRGAAPHLFLTGDPGIGKSHLGVGIWRKAVLRWGTRRTAWLDVPAFCLRVKRGYGAGGDFQDPLSGSEDADALVVFDDLLGRDYSEHEMEMILYPLITTAHSNGAAVVVTLNHPVERLGGRFRSHETSRLLANAVNVPMTGRDQRLGGA